MATITAVNGARTVLTSTGFSTLASATYIATSAYTTAGELDVIIEVTAATTNTPAGNFQVVVFATASLDGTNYQSGPVSGTTATDEGDLTYLGVLPVNTTATTERKTFSLFNAFGYVPYSFKVVLKNDLGVALTSGTVYTSAITGSAV